MLFRSKGHISYSTDSLRNGSYADGNGKAQRLAAFGSYNYNGWTTMLGFNKSKGTIANAAGVAIAGSDVGDLEDTIVFSVDGKIQDFGVGFAAARLGSGDYKMNKFVLNGSYAMGATTIGAYVSQQSELPAVALTDKGVSKTAYGLGASYNLGGGASVVGGIERTTQKSTRADLGVSFRF